MSKTVSECDCKRCGHKWLPRQLDQPVICPKCKNPRWNQEKPQQQAAEDAA